MIENSKKTNEILSLAKSTFQSFSAHGIPKIVSHQFGIVRAMWLIFFLASAGLCAWFIQMTISNYLNYPVTTNTGIFYQKNMIFPMVSICDLNLFSTDSMSQNVTRSMNTLSSNESTIHTVQFYSSVLLFFSSKFTRIFKRNSFENFSQLFFHSKIDRFRKSENLYWNISQKLKNKKKASYKNQIV